MRYDIIYNDGIVYTSPDLLSKDPGWASEDGAKHVGIRQITLNIPGGRKLILRGFEAYNFFVEASQAIGRVGARIEAFNFCGRWGGHVVTWRADLKTSRLTKTVSQDGAEYYGTATRGWRKGLIGERAESGIL